MPGAALGAGAVAGCCCPSPHGNDEQPVPPGTPSSCQQWPGEPQASGSPPGHLCEGPGWPGLPCMPQKSGSGSRDHTSSFGHGPELRRARECSEQGAAPVSVAGGDWSRWQWVDWSWWQEGTDPACRAAGRPWTPRAGLPAAWAPSAPPWGCGAGGRGCSQHEGSQAEPAGAGRFGTPGLPGDSQRALCRTGIPP